MRSRHILSVGLDLGLPTGVLATFSAEDAAQNAYMVSCLLARHGFMYLEAPFLVQLLPAMLAAARGAVFNGVPPYDLWEHPPAGGMISAQETDAGSYLVAEVFAQKHDLHQGCRRNLYRQTEPEPSHSSSRIHADELLERPLPTLPMDHVVPELLHKARLATQVQIINGHVPGNRTRAGWCTRWNNYL